MEGQHEFEIKAELNDTATSKDLWASLPVRLRFCSARTITSITPGWSYPPAACNYPSARKPRGVPPRSWNWRGSTTRQPSRLNPLTGYSLPPSSTPNPTNPRCWKRTFFAGKTARPPFFCRKENGKLPIYTAFSARRTENGFPRACISPFQNFNTNLSWLFSIQAYTRISPVQWET